MAQASALDGIRVLELGHFLAGPFAGQLLCDFGAEVIKVEPPAGDPMRNWGFVKSASNGEGIWWAVASRGKKSVVLDLKSPEGLAACQGLVDRADVLIENFRPGVLERLGFAPETLHERNPRLVILRTTGWGQTGPKSQRAGFGAVAECVAGLRYVTGFPDRPPVRTGISIGDSLAGIFGALGVLLALHSRDRSGHGQVIDVAIYEAVMAVMEAAIAEASVGGIPRERTGNVLPEAVPNGLYETAEEGRWIAVSANADTVFERLAGAMGQVELADDPRFATHGARARNRAAIDEIIAQWTRTKRPAEIEQVLSVAGVAVGPVNSTLDILEDAHIRARGMLAVVRDQVFGDVTMQAPVPRLDKTPGVLRRAPLLGEHTEDVLRRDLQMSGKALEQLLAVVEQARRVRQTAVGDGEAHTDSGQQLVVAGEPPTATGTL